MSKTLLNSASTRGNLLRAAHPIHTFTLAPETERGCGGVGAQPQRAQRKKIVECSRLALRNWRRILLVLGVWILWVSQSLFGATVSVSVGDNFFSPATTNINLNDTVTWTWNGSSSHSSTSDTSIWDSGIKGHNSTFSRQFTVAGSFPYHCVVHAGQSGTITVLAANTPPTVSITSPADGAVLSAPAALILQATASDPGGSVAGVQFKQGSTALTNDTVSPYSVAVANLAAGAYTFSAIATDNLGAQATNSISVMVVNPVPIVLSLPKRVSGTNFQFSYSANIGLKYVVERSASFTNGWSVLATNVAAGSSVTFIHTNVPFTPRYYRVGRLPNP